MKKEDLSITPATEDDVAELAALHASVAEALTAMHGRGHWSQAPGERSVQRGLSTSHIFTARALGQVVGTFRLATKKPWAIDVAYFTPVKKPLYLLDMAVAPHVQRRGIGRALLERAASFVTQLPSDGIRLDAYDSPAGAGGFYSKCGMACRGGKTYRGTPLLYFELVFASQR